MGFRFSNLAVLRSAYRAARSGCPVAGGRIVPIVVENENHWRTTRRWHVGHSHGHHHLGDARDKDGGPDADKVFRMGLGADVALAVGKAVTGYVSGSTAILADAAHSLSDVVLSGVALWSFRAAKAPKDDEHPYGHQKIETLGALGISCMLLVTAGGIAWHTIDLLQGLLMSAPDMISPANHDRNHDHCKHHHGLDLDHPILALSMTFISISVKEGLYQITKRAGERERSELMKANAWHHRADAVSSVVALVGVGGAILGMPYFDPLAGLLVSGMIVKAGIETGYQSVMELVDAGVPLPLLAPIKQTITEVEGVKGCHRLRGRRAGSSMYLDVHIEVDPFLSVSDAHDIGENVRRHIQEAHKQVAEVFIHIDPSTVHCIQDQRKLIEGIEGQNPTILSENQDAKAIVCNILSSRFQEEMCIEHMTRHALQGKILLLVQVSMPVEILIQDAMEMAKEAEQEILKAAPHLNQVSIQLRLGHPIPQFLNNSHGELKR